MSRLSKGNTLCTMWYAHVVRRRRRLLRCWGAAGRDRNVPPIHWKYIMHNVVCLRCSPPEAAPTVLGRGGAGQECPAYPLGGVCFSLQPITYYLRPKPCPVKRLFGQTGSLFNRYPQRLIHTLQQFIQVYGFE